MRVTGVEWAGSGVSGVVTERGTVGCDLAVVVPGPWAQEWLSRLRADPAVVALWRAQEADFALPGVGLQPRAGRESPVVHFDHAGPLHAEDGRVIVDGPWGIYFRLGRTGTGIVGGGLPERLDPAASLEPYGEANAAHVAGAGFVELFTAGLARALKRFRGAGDRWDARPGGGVIALTADGYPVLDRVAPNAYLILDGARPSSCSPSASSRRATCSTAGSRCSSPSGSGASAPAASTPRPRARIRGPDQTARAAQNSPTVRPSSSMSTLSAAGVLPRPGICMMSPHSGTSQPAPV